MEFTTPSRVQVMLPVCMYMYYMVLCSSLRGYSTEACVCVYALCVCAYILLRFNSVKIFL